MLLALSEALETSVSTLLGEAVAEPEAGDLKAISQKLEVINLQLARSKAAKRKALHWLFITLCALIVIIAAVLVSQNSPYIGRSKVFDLFPRTYKGKIDAFSDKNTL